MTAVDVMSTRLQGVDLLLELLDLFPEPRSMSFMLEATYIAGLPFYLLVHDTILFHERRQFLFEAGFLRSQDGIHHTVSPSTTAVLAARLRPLRSLVPGRR